MATTEPPSGSLAGLTDRETAVLRLLASGHTAKTIAVQLGCSEASVNERLRDARRKTGIGSSRELARLMSARKNWDKNIDLPATSGGADSSGQPAASGPRRSKGRIMFIAIPAAAVGLIVMAASAMQQADPARTTVAAAATAPSPISGRWALDVARIPEGERPQRVTITFRALPEQKWTTQVEIVAPDGSISRAASTAGVDGVPVAVTGNMSFLDTVALRQPAPETLVMTLGKNGASVSTRVYTVAKNGKSMTETIVWPGSDLPKLETTHFNRLD